MDSYYIFCIHIYTFAIKNKSFNKLDLKDREEELLTIQECIFLANSKYAKQLKMDGSSTTDDFFIQQPFDLNRKNGYVAGFYSLSNGSGFYCGENSDDSNSDLGCRFKKKLTGN